LWCAAIDCASGGDGRFADDDLGALQAVRHQAAPVVTMLLDGLIVGLRAVPAELAARWPEYGDRLTALIEALGRRWGDPLAARRIQYCLERRILQHDDLAAPRPLALTLGVRVDLGHPTDITLPPAADRLYVHLYDRDRLLAAIELGAQGSVPRERLRALAHRLGLTRTARASRPRLRRVRSAARKVRGVAREALRRLWPRRRDALWEAWFRTPDPWHYGSDYEREKYAHQLAMLPAGRLARVLELACAEGHFTQTLAPRVERLVAADISKTALARAHARCAAFKNVQFRRLDLAHDPLPADLDLIVCSEVLYYLADKRQLEAVAHRLARALRTGGHLVMAHAFVLQDDLSRTGFDWGNRWGAKTIAEVFATVPGLALDRSLQTQLYRVDRYVRVTPSQARDEPLIESCPVQSQLEPEVARHVVWGGATALRHHVQAIERRERMPVLMYHRIADYGPAALASFRVTPNAFRAQIAWLRRHGYHAITSDELAWFLSTGHPFIGRPVMLTFDDGYQDFADHAWPILRAHDMRPEVFIVTDLVGSASVWDSALGEPAPLMDLPTIRRLAGEGVGFGGHLATHRAADALPSCELADELSRSRAALSQWLGRPVQSLAAPYGATDARLRSMAAEHGYRVLYSTRHGAASLRGDPLDLPRIAVHGQMDLDAFTRALEQCR
jgi:peptidoglycan/xylan/chitin deacetylase (PgdA/CDA1 family)/protein-L-isoaspartate O-methyltransferase